MEREENKQAEEKVWLATSDREREEGYIDGFSAERGAMMGTEVGLVLPGFFGNLQLEESPPLGLSLSSDHTDTWALSILSSSSSSLPCLSPPLPPSVGLDGVLAEGRLVLDVYRGGGEVLPVFWECVQERMRGLQYLRLGSEDEGALERALSVLPRLTQLRSLTIRGTQTHTNIHKHIHVH